MSFQTRKTAPNSSGGLKGQGDRTGGLQGGARSAAWAAKAEQGARASMADLGTPWAMAGSPPPSFFGKIAVQWELVKRGLYGLPDRSRLLGALGQRGLLGALRS